MRIKLKDIKTGVEVWSKMDANLFWWAEGNGSCDCNRALEFDDSVDEELASIYGEGYCYGSERLIAVDIDGDHECASKAEAIAAINHTYLPCENDDIH